ncbi:hypothetical protein EOM81_10965 [bacterium]|nr:hypothetical protein [bacterium]
MDQQIMNIAIKVGELQQQSSSAFHQSWVAITVAGLGFLGTVIAACITAALSRRLHQQQKEHEKQWAFINKRSLLIDQAIDVCAKILYNRPLVIYRNDQAAAANLYVLQKDALVIESQLVVYFKVELAQDFFDFKNLILNTPNDQFLNKWGEIYNKGHEYLLKLRNELGSDVSEKFDDFAKKLASIPPSIPPSKEDAEYAQASSIGKVS